MNLSSLKGANALLGALAVAVGGTLLWLERGKKLRQTVEPWLPHTARNLAVAATAAGVVLLLEKPTAEPLARLVERDGWGLAQNLPVPRIVRDVLAVLLLDYTLYLWHVLTHQVPFLWRFHQVHHIDRDLDASTAIRFHFGEMACSVPFRAAQVLVIGVSPQALAVWQSCLFASIIFHHSNLRLPLGWERRLAHIIVTPRIHGIHHSDRPLEMNSNWSSGLTVWDWIHKTLRTDAPQAEIHIGIPNFESDEDVRLKRILALPFEQEQVHLLEETERVRQSPASLRP